MSAVVVELPLMVDLALGTPQLGAVNFNILHSLLHVMIQQLRLTDTLVEIRGNTGVVVNNMLSCNKASGGPSLTLSEFELQEPAKLSEGRYQSADPPRSTGPATPGANKESDMTEIAKKGKKIEKKKKTSLQKLVVVRKVGEVPEKTVPVEVTPSIGPATSQAISAAEQPLGFVGAEDFHVVTQRVASIEKHIHMLEDLPTHKEILEQIRSGQGNVVAEVWNIILLSKRMEAAESGINKLTAVIEQVAKEYTNVNVDLQTVKVDGSKDEVRGRLDIMEKRIYDLEVAGGGKPSSPPSSSPHPQTFTVIPAPEPVNSGNPELDGAIQTMRDNIYNLQNEMERLKMTVAEMPQRSAGSGEQYRPATPVPVTPDGSHISGDKGEIGANLDNLTDIEDKLQKFGVQMTGLDSHFNKQMACFQKQICTIEKEVGVILERINAAGLPMPDTDQEFSGLGELYTKIKGLQHDMDQINTTATSLLEDREERQVHINALLEQIEFLKTVKADKEDLEDALADKADYHLVNRKVSHDQFDAACDDLSRGLEEALSKLTEQETLWQIALDDVQKEIENKLDKIEISPLKDFVNNKLKSLQDRLKALAALKKDSEAAGTRSKYIRNVNCISCDKDVVMRTEEAAPQIPIPGMLPPNMSMKPYLTYELDAVRKQQRQLPNRNLNHFEMAMKEEKKKKGYDRSKCEELGKTHVCNRYCGGSHTTTTPQQRVTRMGHFIQQWGPEAIKLTEGTTKGTDNRVYKTVEPEKRLSSAVLEGRPNTRASDTCVAPETTPTPTDGYKSPTKSGSKTSLASGKKSTSPRGSVDKMKRGSKGSAAKLPPVPEVPAEEGEKTEAQHEGVHVTQEDEGYIAHTEGEDVHSEAAEGEEAAALPAEGGGEEVPPPEEA